jgi:hypothetical protein
MGLVGVLVTSLAVAKVLARTTPASIIRGVSSRSRRSSATSAALVTAQIALAVVIVVATSAVALVASRLARIQVGYDRTEAVVFDVTLPRAAYGDRPAVTAFTEDVVAQLAALPGVTAAGATNLAPGGQGVMLAATLQLDDFVETSSPAGDGPGATSTVQTGIAMSATPDFFRALGVPLVAGRYFDRTDTRDGALVAVLTVSAAKVLSPDPSAVIGRRLASSRVLGGAPEIVGVVGDIRLRGRARFDCCCAQTRRTRR